MPEGKGINSGNFRVTLFWNQTYFFPSKKKASRFVAIANQFLTQAMYEARTIYIDVWVKYQRDWGYFDHDKKGADIKLYDKERRCERALNDCQESFSLMSERSNWENGHFIVRLKMDVVINSLREAVSILQELHSNKSGTMELYALDVITKRIYALEFAIKSFGDYESQHLSKPLTHETKIQPSTLMANAKMSAA